MQIQRETYCRSLESDALCGQTNFLLLVHCVTRSCNVMVVQNPYMTVRINCCESEVLHENCSEGHMMNQRGQNLCIDGAHQGQIPSQIPSGQHTTQK